MNKRESVRKRIADTIATSAERVLVRSASEFFSTREQETPSALAKAILKRMNIQPEYLREQTSSPQEFKKLRRSLEREPGVLISNHPGGADALALLAMINRKDILILVGGRRLKKYEVAPAIQKYLIQRTSNPGELRKQLQTIEEHITNGGLFVIFPTGGDKRSQNTTFRDGFRVIVEKILRPTDMIYTCSVNAEDAAAIRREQGRHYAGMFSDGMFGEVINVNKWLKTKRIRVDERYTAAQSWKEVIAESSSKDATNRALTNYYHALWKKNAIQSTV